MTPDETPDERTELLDLLASLRTDGVDPDADEVGRARDLDITDDDIDQRAAVIAGVRADLLALTDVDAAALTEDELTARRSVRRAIELGQPDSASRSAPTPARRVRRIPSPVVAVAAATVIIAGVGLGGWLVAQDSSEQLASTGDGGSFDAATSDLDATEESEAAQPALPPDVPVIGTALTPDEAIELAERQWGTARTSAPDDATAGAGQFDGDEATAPETDRDPAGAEDPDRPVDQRCGTSGDPADVVVVVIDDSPHLVVRTADGSVVVLRLVDCREVARA